MSYKDIATGIPSVTVDGVRKLYTRTRKRAGSDNITILKDYSSSKLRSSRLRRVELGLLTSERIR